MNGKPKSLTGSQLAGKQNHIQKPSHLGYFSEHCSLHSVDPAQPKEFVDYYFFLTNLILSMKKYQ